MSDLTDEELASIERSLGGPSNVMTSRSETCRMVAEIKRHRAAQALDEEGVRKIVLGILFDLLPGDVKVDLADAIANRAARQLAGAAVRLDDQQLADVSNAISDLERGSRGRMPYDLTVRDVLLRLLATVRP